MKLHNLPKTNSRAKKMKRVGCGRGSGHGKTSGRGHKGGNARSGYSTPSNYSGIPYYRRFPKRGFNNYNFRQEFEEINLSTLEQFFVVKGFETVDNEALFNAGLIKCKSAEVKILGVGSLTKPLTVKATKFSKSAKEKIESVGGKAIV